MKVMIKTRLFRKTILTAGAIFTILYVPLVSSTEQWRVYGNDIMPTFHSWESFFFGKGHKWYLVSAAFGFHTSLLFLSLVSGFIFVRYWCLRVPVAIVLFCCFFCFRHWVISSRLENAVESCGNHASFWGNLGQFASDVSLPDLPDSTEFYDYLAAKHPDIDPYFSGLRCPGYKRTGTRTGVVFVGGSLDLSSLNAGVLIAFCSWQSHPPPHDHQHALVWEGTYERRNCASDVKEMIDLIEKAITQGVSGKTPYTPKAMQILHYELEQRKRLLQQD